MSNQRKQGYQKKTDGAPRRNNNGGNNNNNNYYSNDRRGPEGDKEKRTYPDPVLVGALSLVEQIDS